MKKLNESYFRLFETAWSNLQLVKKESSAFRVTRKTTSTSDVTLKQQPWVLNQY